ncbi:hypothetical protein SK128_000178 [Halocaridina rubra]|uniref:Uncharacterized protein n=1 Tax=Halocaridina rubra TaxID=373956 RepID=A0AAN9A3Q1_HALRR
MRVLPYQLSHQYMDTNEELFCSDVCRATALKGIHGKDCIVLMKLLEVDSDIQHYTLINLMYQTTFAQLKEYLPEIEVEAKELPPEKLGYNRDGVYATDFRAVYHMPKEEQCDNSDELQFRCGFAAVFLTKLLHKRVNYFKNSLGVPVKPSHEDFILIGKVILDLYLKMPLMIALFTHSVSN